MLAVSLTKMVKAIWGDILVLLMWITWNTLPTNAASHTIEACMEETFLAQCSRDQVVVIDMAEYGRMETGKCIHSNSDNIGCRHDVLYLLDKWCSGQKKCEFLVTQFQKVQRENQWCDDRISYVKATYNCITVVQPDFRYCVSHKKVLLTNHEGFVASHVTDETGCGSNIPWVIEAKPGLTIDISLLDFGALSREYKPGYSDCKATYGFIVEKSLGINRTICGVTDRQSDIYRSKANVVEIHVLAGHQRGEDHGFLLHYKTVGCIDLKPPDRAWYKREGNKATIGCDDNDRRWDLKCVHNVWQGVVGNCSVLVAAVKGKEEDFPMFTVLILSSVIGVTVVLSLLILALGIFYIKKKKRRQERAKNTKKTTDESKPVVKRRPKKDLRKKPAADILRPQSQPPAPAPPVPLSDTFKSMAKGGLASRPPSLPAPPVPLSDTFKSDVRMRVMTHYRPMSYGGPGCGTMFLPGTFPLIVSNRSSMAASNRNSTSTTYAQIIDKLPDPREIPGPINVIEGPDILSERDSLLQKNTNAHEPSLPRRIMHRRTPGGSEGLIRASILLDDNRGGYYSPNTGHKYYVLEVQDDQAQS